MPAVEEPPGTALLGEVVTWDLQGSEIEYETVRTALTAAGLDPAAAKELQPRSAFGRACKHLKAERAIDKLQIEHGVARFQFTHKSLDSGRVNYDYECTVSLNCDTGTISCPENPPLEQQARELLAFAIRTRNAQDVTRLVQKLFQEHADLYPINPHKGVAYFVPERHRDFTAKVDQFLRDLGGCLARFPVPKGTAEGNASVKEAVQSGLSGLLAELNAAVESWDDTTRKATMDKAAERYLTIAYKVDAYAEYLGSEQERLKDEMAKAKEQLARKVSELSTKDEAPAQAA